MNIEEAFEKCNNPRKQSRSSFCIVLVIYNRKIEPQIRKNVQMTDIFLNKMFHALKSNYDLLGSSLFLE